MTKPAGWAPLSGGLSQPFSPPLVTALEKNSNTFAGVKYAKNVSLRSGRGGFVVDGSGAKCAGAGAIGDAEGRSWRAIHTVALSRFQRHRFRRGRTRHLQRHGQHR